MKAPFTLLTGFLGAGKTTALNRLLAGAAASPSGRRVAVLVNELGRVAIDNRLIVGASGDVIELAGGCLCCKLDMRSDLWGGIVDIIERSKPDHVILETTGIAEPPAILDGLEHFKVREWVEPAGVVCVVDAARGGLDIEERSEARSQLECADRVLLSKLDIAEEEATSAAHRRIADVNHEAERASFPLGDHGGRALAEWVCERRKLRKRSRSGHHHSHTGAQISAASFVDGTPLAQAPLLEMVNELASDLLRIKGFVHLAGEAKRGILELAGGRVELRLGEPWADEPPRTELVFIGEHIADDMIRRMLWACAVGDAAAP